MITLIFKVHMISTNVVFLLIEWYSLSMDNTYENSQEVYKSV